MVFLARFSPFRAIRDLRVFLSQRHPYELVALMLALMITAFFIFAFAHDSRVEPTYHRDIVYVQQWRADRTDAEIRAQQAIDAPIEAARKEAIRKEAEERRRSFQRVEKAMKAWGM